MPTSVECERTSAAHGPIEVDVKVVEKANRPILAGPKLTDLADLTDLIGYLGKFSGYLRITSSSSSSSTQPQVNADSCYHLFLENFTDGIRALLAFASCKAVSEIGPMEVDFGNGLHTVFHVSPSLALLFRLASYQVCLCHKFLLPLLGEGILAACVGLGHGSKLVSLQHLQLWTGLIQFV